MIRGFTPVALRIEKVTPEMANGMVRRRNTYSGTHHRES